MLLGENDWLEYVIVDAFSARTNSRVDCGNFRTSKVEDKIPYLKVQYLDDMSPIEGIGHYMSDN